MEYYSYRLKIRSKESPLHLCGRLFHQYAVDMYARTAEAELHQDEPAEDSNGSLLWLSDAVAADDTDSRELGRKIVLPSSYTGSPRQMFELYQDAMSIVRKYGKPDLYITFTCNLNQKTSDRAYLIVRVFRMKLRELLEVIMTKHVLGKPLEHVIPLNSRSVVCLTLTF